MTKAIIKEIGIVMLLLIAIIIILGIIFYDYIPTNKLAPSKVAPYILSEEEKLELETSTGTETQNIIKTYVIDSKDLKNYERKNEYNKGKINPFEEYSLSTNSTNNSTGFLNTVGK